MGGTPRVHQDGDTVSLNGDRYALDPALVERKVQLVLILPRYVSKRFLN